MSSPPGAEPSWQIGDFFTLEAVQIRTLKIKIASHLGLRLGPCNQSKAFAKPVGATLPYESVQVKKEWEEHVAKVAIASADPNCGMTSLTVNG